MTATDPTVGTWIDAERLLKAGIVRPSGLGTSFRHGGGKEEEGRLTGQLGPLRDQAQGG